MPIRDSLAGCTRCKNPTAAAGLLQVVYDPFFQDMPRFFGCTFKELLAAKHPTAWLQVGCRGSEGKCRGGQVSTPLQHTK